MPCNFMHGNGIQPIGNATVNRSKRVDILREMALSESHLQYVQTRTLTAADEGEQRHNIVDRARDFEKYLQEHEGALAMKKQLESRFSGKELDFWMCRTTALQHEIKDPAFFFHCNAAIEAHRRYKSGEEFDWIDLLPVRLSAAISGSLAYMNGAKLTPESDSDE